MDKYNNYSYYDGGENTIALIILLAMLAGMMFLVGLANMSKQEFYMYVGVYIDRYLFRLKLKKFNVIFANEIGGMTPDKVDYLTKEERQSVKKSTKKALQKVGYFNNLFITEEDQKKVDLVDAILKRINHTERLEKQKVKEAAETANP